MPVAARKMNGPEVLMFPVKVVVMTVAPLFELL
jgi:hypothetical protein